MKRVRADAPTRVDLAGGTLDLPPLYLFHRPAITVNVAIQLRAKVAICPSEHTTVISHDRELQATWDGPGEASWADHPELELIVRAIRSFDPNEGLRVEVDSEAPAGSGLGGSSALAIALTAALARWFAVELSKEELVEYAKSIETQTIKVPTGYQDYWGAVYGKMHAYEMGLNGKVRVTALGSDAFRRELERHMLLVYVGRPRFSGANNWELFRRHIDGDRTTVEFFERLKENAIAMKMALESEDLGRVAQVLNEDWRTRRAMLPGMTTPEIEALVEAATKRGALGARVCGAGGGGCVLLLVDPASRPGLVAAIEGMDMRVIPARVAEQGVTIEAHR